MSTFRPPGLGSRRRRPGYHPPGFLSKSSNRRSRSEQWLFLQESRCSEQLAPPLLGGSVPDAHGHAVSLSASSGVAAASSMPSQILRYLDAAEDLDHRGVLGLPDVPEGPGNGSRVGSRGRASAGSADVGSDDGGLLAEDDGQGHGGGGGSDSEGVPDKEADEGGDASTNLVGALSIFQSSAEDGGDDDGDGGGSGSGPEGGDSGGPDSGGGDDDDGRAPSPIIIWRASARVRLAEDVPAELMQELEDEAAALNEEAGLQLWSTSGAKGPGGGGGGDGRSRGPRSPSSSLGGPGRGREGGGGGGGAAAKTFSVGAESGGGAGRAARRRGSPRTKHLRFRTRGAGTAGGQGARPPPPPPPESGFTYRPYIPRRRPKYGAWYLPPDTWHSRGNGHRGGKASSSSQGGVTGAAVGSGAPGQDSGGGGGTDGSSDGPGVGCGGAPAARGEGSGGAMGGGNVERGDGAEGDAGHGGSQDDGISDRASAAVRRRERRLRAKINKLPISKEYKRFVLEQNRVRMENREEPLSVPIYLRHVSA